MSAGTEMRADADPRGAADVGAAPRAAAGLPAGRRRVVAIWVVLAAAVVGVAVLGAWLSALGQYEQRSALDPEARAPAGARAVAEVLRDHGVDVEVVRLLDDALAADGDATLVITDDRILPEDALVTLADRTGTFVDLSPDGLVLDLLWDGSSTAAAPPSPEPVPAGCDVAAIANAGGFAPVVRYAAAGDAIGCYGGPAASGLLVLDVDGATRYAIDGASVLANDVLAEGDNAALAVALLGGADRLVWYVPAADDPALATGQTLGDVTPGWVTPAIMLLAVAAIVAMVWRGRRFGPLVAETLPVTVRASETTAGRARLYARAGDPVHAADQLRIAAAGRLTRLLALGPQADATAIVDAAALRLGADRAAVRAVLVDDAPTSDRDLVDLAARLDHLEAAVRAAVTPGRTRP